MENLASSDGTAEERTRLSGRLHGDANLKPLKFMVELSERSKLMVESSGKVWHKQKQALKALRKRHLRPASAEGTRENS